jgi:hypothetical protein
MPNTINFFGDDTVAGAARVGLAASVPAVLADAQLAAAMQRTSVQLVYNKGGWVLLDDHQPAGLQSWVTGDVVAEPSAGLHLSIPSAPLLVSTSYGAGRIVYTTFHVHQQATEDMRAVLTYMIFEL